MARTNFDSEGNFTYAAMVNMLKKNLDSLEELTKTEVKILVEGLPDEIESICKNDCFFNEATYNMLCSIYDYVEQASIKCGWLTEYGWTF